MKLGLRMVMKLGLGMSLGIPRIRFRMGFELELKWMYLIVKSIYTIRRQKKINSVLQKAPGSANELLAEKFK